MSQRWRVIIVGGGFGGLRAAQALNSDLIDVTLIDRRNYHLFRKDSTVREKCSLRIRVNIFDPAGAWLIVTIAVLQFAIEVVVERNYALALAFITPTALTIAATGASTSGALVSERIVDTVLGTMIAMVVLRMTEWMCQRDRRLGMNFVRCE